MSTTLHTASGQQAPANSRRGRVVVGVDGSAPSAQALAWAGDEAVRREATLHVVHAWMPPYPLGPTELFADLSPLEDAARELLDEEVDELTRRRPAPTTVDRTLLMDDAATALVDTSAGADLLVIGAGGRRALLGFTIGSVSRRCAERAPCPVVVVHEDCPPADNRRIVAGIDGSQLSCRALRWAAHEAALRRVTLEVVHAWDPTPSLFAPLTRRSPATASAELLEVTMAACAAELRGPPLTVNLRSLPGPAAATLVSAAQGADLLVVGARSTARLRDRLLGSTAQRCIEQAQCPISVVHADDDWTVA